MNTSDFQPDSLDDELRSLFENSTPAADFEDQLIAPFGQRQQSFVVHDQAASGGAHLHPLQSPRRF